MKIDVEEFRKEPDVSIDLDGSIILHVSKEPESSIELDGSVNLVGRVELVGSDELGGCVKLVNSVKPNCYVELGGSIKLDEWQHCADVVMELVIREDTLGTGGGKSVR